MRNKNVAFHQSTVDVSDSSTAVLPVNSTRTYLLLQNMGAGTIWLNLSGDAVEGEGIRLAVDEAYEPYAIPTNAIEAIGDVAATLIVVEA